MSKSAHINIHGPARTFRRQINDAAMTERSIYACTDAAERDAHRDIFRARLVDVEQSMQTINERVEASTGTVEGRKRVATHAPELQTARLRAAPALAIIRLADSAHMAAQMQYARWRRYCALNPSTDTELLMLRAAETERYETDLVDSLRRVYDAHADLTRLETETFQVVLANANKKELWG